MAVSAWELFVTQHNEKRSKDLMLMWEDYTPLQRTMALARLYMSALNDDQLHTVLERTKDLNTCDDIVHI